MPSKTAMSVVASLTVVALLTGCASVMSTSVYPVAINSDPSGADITVVDESGQTVFSGKTPTSARLDAHAGFCKGHDYTVHFRLAGHTDQSASIKRGLDRWYTVGNFFTWGPLGWLLIDADTGAMWALEPGVRVTLSPE
jgi:uncharacterized protein YceK